MTKKWTEAYPRDNAIVDYKQFNKGYNAYKSTFNGGIDRTITPSEVLDETVLQDRAFHKMVLYRRGDVEELEDTTSVTDDFRGISYNTYGGGWVTVDEFSLNGMKNGMLHWEFSSHVYNYTYYSSQNPKACTIRLMFDGVEVAHAYKIPAPTLTFRLLCDVPITASPNTVRVQVRNAAFNDGDGTRCLFQLLGMQHLFIGRWR